MTDTNLSLADSIRKALRQLRGLPGELEAADDPAFTAEQVNFLEKRLYEVRALLEAAQPDDGLVRQEVHARSRKTPLAAPWATNGGRQMSGGAS